MHEFDAVQLSIEGERNKKAVSVMDLLLLVVVLCCYYCCFGSTVSAFSTPSISCSRNHHHDHSFSLAGATTAAITSADDDTTSIPNNGPLLQQKSNNNNPSAFELLAQTAINTLLKSDVDTDENEHAYGSASQGLWINSMAAKEMQNVLDRVVLQVSLRIITIIILCCCIVFL